VSDENGAGIPPEKLPDPFLIDSEYFLQELARIRGLALSVPLTLESYGPTNTIVDSLWRLETQLRYLLQLHRAGQRSFAQKHALVALKPASAAPSGGTVAKPVRATRSVARRA